MKRHMASYFGWAVVALLLSPALMAEGAPPSSDFARLTLEDLVDTSGLQGVTLSPDGRKVTLVQDGQIEMVSSDGGWPQILTSTVGGKQGLEWSQDGHAIAFVSEGSIWTVPVAGGQPRRLTEGRPGPGDPRSAADRAPHWSPDGKWILYETGRRGNADLGVVSADGLTQTLLTSSPADQESAAWSPDGTRIAYIERSRDYFSGRLVVAEFDTLSGQFKGEPKVLYTAKEDRGGGWDLRRPVWSPDGKSLAIILQDTGWNKIYLIPASGGEPHALTTG